MYVNKEIMDKFNEYQMFLEKTYKEYENKLKVDYDTGTIEIEGKTYTLEKLEQIINVLKGTDEKKNMIDRNTYLDDHNQYYTIVDYRYYYIQHLIKKKFNVYDIAKYFQVSPKSIKESIKRIPEINKKDIKKENIPEQAMKAAIKFRNSYIEKALLKINDPLLAGQKIGFFKVPNQEDMTTKIMTLLTQNKYNNINKKDFEKLLQLPFKDVIAKDTNNTINYLFNNMTEKKWNKLKIIYKCACENQSIIELKTYKFKNNEIAEYLNISEEYVKNVLNTINTSFNNISIFENLFVDKHSQDITILKLVTEMIKQGDELQDIYILSGLCKNYISEIRKNMKMLGEIKDDFSDSKKAKIRQSNVINLYINTAKSQQQIAYDLHISRRTVANDIENYLKSNPEIIPFVKKKKKYMSKSSRAEQLILEILKPYGFIHGKTGTLQDSGLGRLELDIFNKERKIAIEYDGFIIKKMDILNGHTKERDLKKDRCCSKNGIDLIRIREPQLDDYEYECKKIFKTNTISGNIYDEKFLKCINDLINYLNNTYNFNIPPVLSVIPYEEKLFKLYEKEMNEQKQITKNITTNFDSLKTNPYSEKSNNIKIHSNFDTNMLKLYNNAYDVNDHPNMIIKEQEENER